MTRKDALKLFGPGVVTFILLSLLPWYFTTIFLSGLLAYLMYTTFIRPIRAYRQLQCATLSVDGHVYVYKYARGFGDGYISYGSILPITEYPNRLMAFSSREFDVSQQFQIDQELEELPKVEATLQIAERTFKFEMAKQINARCPCESPTPCWSGTGYIGMFSDSESEEKWAGGVALVIKDSRGIRKRRPKAEKKHAQRPSWSFNPSPVPA